MCVFSLTSTGHRLLFIAPPPLIFSSLSSCICHALEALLTAPRTGKRKLENESSPSATPAGDQSRCVVLPFLFDFCFLILDFFLFFSFSLSDLPKNVFQDNKRKFVPDLRDEPIQSNDLESRGHTRSSKEAKAALVSVLRGKGTFSSMKTASLTSTLSFCSFRVFSATLLRLSFLFKITLFSLFICLFDSLLILPLFTTFLLFVFLLFNFPDCFHNWADDGEKNLGPSPLRGDAAFCCTRMTLSMNSNKLIAWAPPKRHVYLVEVVRSLPFRHLSISAVFFLFFLLSLLRRFFFPPFFFLSILILSPENATRCSAAPDSPSHHRKEEDSGFRAECFSSSTGIEQDKKKRTRKKKKSSLLCLLTPSYFHTFFCFYFWFRCCCFARGIKQEKEQQQLNKLSSIFPLFVLYFTH